MAGRAAARASRVSVAVGVAIAPPSPGNGVVSRKLKPERYAAISVAILGDPISNCGPLVVTAEHNRSLEEVGGRPSRPEWLVDQFKDGIALHSY